MPTTAAYGLYCETSELFPCRVFLYDLDFSTMKVEEMTWFELMPEVTKLNNGGYFLR